jgi:hypothetical protein
LLKDIGLGDKMNDIDDFPDEAEPDPVMVAVPYVDLHLGVPEVKPYKSDFVETNLFKKNPYLLIVDPIIGLMAVGFIWLIFSVWRWVIFS